MVYLSGDNNLDSWMVRAFNRLESVADNPNLHICALWDRKGSGDTRRYVVEHDDNPFELADYITDVNVWDMGELNMGDPQTLYDFMTWARETCPAQHYLLAIVDHGGGWSPELPPSFREYAQTGLSWDDTDDLSFLSTQDLGEVFRTFTNNGTDKIDVVFYDACLMATIEDAYEVKDYVEYLVASENVSWAVFAYDAYLAGITAETEPRDLAVAVVDEYDHKLRGYPRTMGALRLSAVDVLSTAVDALAEALGLAVSEDSERVPEIRRAFGSAQKFDCNWDGKLTEKDSCVDLYHFAQLLRRDVDDDEVRTAAQAVMDAIGEVGGSFMMEERHDSGFTCEGVYWSLENAHGLSVYVPFGERPWLHDYYNEEQLAFARDTRWEEFLNIYLAECYAPYCPGLGPEPTSVDPGERPGPISPYQVTYMPLILKGR